MNTTTTTIMQKIYTLMVPNTYYLLISLMQDGSIIFPDILAFIKYVFSMDKKNVLSPIDKIINLEKINALIDEYNKTPTRNINLIDIAKNIFNVSSDNEHIVTKSIERIITNHFCEKISTSFFEFLIEDLLSNEEIADNYKNQNIRLIDMGKFKNVFKQYLTENDQYDENEFDKCFYKTKNECRIVINPHLDKDVYSHLFNLITRLARILFEHIFEVIDISDLSNMREIDIMEHTFRMKCASLPKVYFNSVNETPMNYNSDYYLLKATIPVEISPYETKDHFKKYVVELFSIKICNINDWTTRLCLTNPDTNLFIPVPIVISETVINI